MKKRFISVLLCLVAFPPSLIACQKEPSEKEGLTVTYQEGKCHYHVYFQGESHYRVYSSRKKEGPYTLVEEDNKGDYSSEDYTAYYYFESKDGKKKTEPYSYLKSTFQSDDVVVFDPEDDPSEIQQDIDLTYNQMVWDEFATERKECLFAPGENKDITAKIGYYTVIAGLGKTPADVKVKTLLREDSPLASGALCNFWCGGENFSTSESAQFYVS